MKYLAFVLLVGTACRNSAPASFENDLSSIATPWTHDRFDDEDGKFTFAVISDLNGGEREHIFDVAVQQLALLRPELILSVGDLIEGGSADPKLLGAEWDEFDARASRAAAPLFHVGGNHDLTGQVLKDVWAERYGPTYYHFVYKNVLFLVLDTEDHTPERMQEIFEARNAVIAAQARGETGVQDMAYYQMPERVTGNIGPEQSEYFRNVLADHPDVRWTMLFMHKPVWLEDADPDFVAIESALSSRPYTVFNGHFHSMSYTERHGRDYVMLGTTGGSQNPNDSMSFDHVSLVTMAEGGPSIAHIRLDGILAKNGQLPADGEQFCFQASVCGAGN